MYEGSYEQEDAKVAKKRDEGNWQKNIGGRKISGFTKTGFDHESTKARKKDVRRLV